MATLSKIVPAAGGTALTLAAATAGAGGDEYLNTGKEMLVVDNASGGSINVTFVAKKGCSNGGVLHDKVVAVAAGAREFLPPVSTEFYNDPDTGRVQVTFSSVVTVTVGVLSPT